MARPTRNNVDYFPHECVHGRKMHIIETKYQNNGYAVWFKLLEQLGKSNFHYIDISDDTQKMYLASIFKVDENMMLDIIGDLAKINAINKELYEEHSIIFSEKFIESIGEAYKKRNNKCITLQGLCEHLLSKSIPKPTSNGVKGSKNPQRKEKKSKEEKSKVYTEIFNFWNTQKIIVHKELSSIIKNQIEIKLKDFSEEQIKEAIGNYQKILASPKTYFNHKWTLQEFLERKNGMPVFLYKNENDYLKSDFGEKEEMTFEQSGKKNYLQGL